ncbi:MAG TPA: ABC transporter permease [Polyangiaceae bacterium]|nr:ABC transporter permease [Polyangiaceae bacterium]
MSATSNASAETTNALPADDGLAASIGRAVFESIHSTREVYGVLVRTLYYIARARTDRDAVIRQMYEIGNRSLFLLTVVIGFIGMIFVLQAGLQMQRVIPDLTMLGASFMELLVRELAPTIVALMLATRVGAGIAAEIGSMVVTEQIDALRMCAADPIDYLVKPRFIACLLMTTVLTLWSGGVSVASGIVTAEVIFQVTPRTFWNLSLVHASDVATGLTKCIAYGAAIPIVSAHCGLSTFGGSEGVGSATTRAVVQSSLAVIVLNFIISSTAFLVFK